MTGEPGYESAAMAIRIKASGYLCKPVRKEDLFEAVGAALEEKAQNDKRRELEKENHRYRESLERLVEERSAQLRQNALRARAMIDASPEAILLIDLEGTILECNQGFVCQAGGTREQLIGSSAYQTTPDAEGDRRRALDEVVRTRQPVHMSGKRGSREIKGSLMPVLDDQGQVAQIAIFVRDALEA